MLQVTREAVNKHRSVLALCAQLEAAVSEPEPGNYLDLFYLRFACYSAMSRRLHYYEHVFCSRLEAVNGGKSMYEAKRVGASARIVVDRMAEHLIAWPTYTITQDWARFCSETRDMLALVKQHVRAEALRIRALLEAVELQESLSVEAVTGLALT